MSGFPRPRGWRPLDGKAGRLRNAGRGDRSHDDGSLRSADGWRVSRHRRPLWRDHPQPHSFHRLRGRPRHGQFRRTGHHSGAIPPAQAARSQSAGDVDAHHAGGERAHRALDRRQAQPDGRAGAILSAGRRGLRARRAGPAVLGSRGRCRAVRRAGTQRASNQQSPAYSSAAQHQRTRICIRHRQRAPPSGRTPGDPSESREVTMAKFERSAILKKFRNMAAKGEPIVGGGAGTGLSAKCEEAGGVDLIVIYNSGRYRLAGRGSLAGMMPYGDANAIVLEMAGEVLPVVTRTPVLAGVNGTDPFRNMDLFLDQLKMLGFSGVQNFPTVGLIDGTFRINLEETGMSYALEIEMIAKAHEMDMLTTPYVFSEAEAAAMAIAGADILVAHMGLTTGGTIGAETAPA